MADGPEMVRKFSCRARQYMCAYHHVHLLPKNKRTLHVSLKEVEKFCKKLKTKRSALDMDYKFIETESKRKIKRFKQSSPELVVMQILKLDYITVSFGKVKNE